MGASAMGNGPTMGMMGGGGMLEMPGDYMTNGQEVRAHIYMG